MQFVWQMWSYLKNKNSPGRNTSHLLFLGWLLQGSRAGESNPKYKEFREMFHNVVDIHTSGHADRQTIEKVIKTVQPKEVICIHKEADAKL